MKITFTKILNENKSLIYLTGKKTKIKKLNLSEKEIKYIQEQKNKGENIITLNHYNRYIYIILLSNKQNKNKIKEKNRIQGYKTFNLLKKHDTTNLQLDSSNLNTKTITNFLEGLLLSNYSFSKYRTKNTKEREFLIKTIKIKNKILSPIEIEHLQIITEAVFLCKDLVNEPFSGLNSIQFAKKIEQASKNAGFKVETLTKKQIKAEKMGGLLAVNKASNTPPTFSILEWKPQKPQNKKPIILIGKGVVFDTGGYNLKPGKHMNDMKTDMAGAAAVLATLYAIAKLKLPIYVIGLIPATDNMINQNGYVTGDIIKMHNGMTVEILNTDAEGRLILADALSYAQKYKPKMVIDIATLTGAAIVATGTQASSIMTNNKTISKKIKKAANQTYERVIEFPLWEEYQTTLKSQIADIKNIGGPYAGHITAAKFLEHFTNYPWLHIDIAATAYADKTSEYKGTAATGTPVRLLINFIEEKIKNKTPNK